MTWRHVLTLVGCAGLVFSALLTLHLVRHPEHSVTAGILAGGWFVLSALIVFPDQVPKAVGLLIRVLTRKHGDDA